MHARPSRCNVAIMALQRLLLCVIVAFSAVVVLALAPLRARAVVEEPDYGKLPLIADQNWDTMTGPDSNGQKWDYVRGSGDSPSSITTDPTAPISPGNVLEIRFIGTDRDTGPGNNFTNFGARKEIYAEWWMKFSDNWTCSPAGCGKIHFFLPPSGADMYSGIYCPQAPSGCGLKDSAFKIGGQLQWPPYGGTPMFTNIGVDNRILRNQWVKIAEYLKWESIPGMSKDGIWRAWVNGVLTMNYTDRTFPDLVGIAEFQFSMTRQMPVSLDERAWVDHTIVRGR